MAEAPATQRGMLFREIGASGLNIQAGINFEEFRTELKGQDGIKIYTEMSSNSAVIGAILFTIEQMLQQTEWKVEPFSEDNEDQPAKDFVDECLNDMSMSWADTLSEIVTFLTYGWSFHEIVYKMRRGPNPQGNIASSKFNDGKIGWRYWPLRGQNTLLEWVGWDIPDAPRAMTQQLNYPQYLQVTIPLDKALLFRTSVEKDNPEGRSLLRRAYRSWFYTKRFEEIEAVGVERDLAGLPILTPPENLQLWNESDPEMVSALSAATKLVQQVRRGAKEGVILPFGWTLSLLSATGRRQFDLNATIQRYETRMAMTCLADFIFLGQGNVGSWALAQPLSAKVLTPTGWRTMGDMKPGDRVSCPLGHDSTVLDTFDHGLKANYRVTLADGRTVQAAADHKWVVTTAHWKKAQSVPARPRLPWAPIAPDPYDQLPACGVLTTEQIAERMRLGAVNSRFHVPRTKPVVFADQSPPAVDPYVLGVLLGDGHFGKHDISFTSADLEVVSKVNERLPTGYRTTLHGGARSAPQYRITHGRGSIRPNELMSAIKDYGLADTRSKTKFIPEVCLRATVDDRLWLLRGLMDTDGYIASHGQTRFTTASEQLRDGIVELVRGLGGGVYVGSRITVGYPHPITKLFVEKAQRKWIVTLSMPDDMNPFYLKRKAERVRPSEKPQDTGIVRIEKIGEELMRCIAVTSPSAMYLTNDYTPTHNSSDKTKMFVLALGGFLRRIVEVVNRHAIPPLLRLNGFDESRPPRLSHGDIETQNLVELANYITAMTNVGAIMFPDESLERHLRTVADLPEAEPIEEDQLPEPPPEEPPELTAEKRRWLRKSLGELSEIYQAAMKKRQNGGAHP